MGVRRKRCHELACVLTHLCERIEGWSVLQLRRGATGAAKVTTGSIFLKAVPAPHTYALQAMPGQRTNTPIAHQVREQLQTHALSASTREQNMN